MSVCRERFAKRPRVAHSSAKEMPVCRRGLTESKNFCMLLHESTEPIQVRVGDFVQSRDQPVG
jgi:hypothetical protein